MKAAGCEKQSLAQAAGFGKQSLAQAAGLGNRKIGHFGYLESGSEMTNSMFSGSKVESLVSPDS